MKTRNLPYPCNSFEFVKSVEGSALMITAVVVMAMVTVSAVLLNDVITHSKLMASYENNYLLRYAADAGLEQVKYQSRTSAYTGTRNVWLMSNSSTAGTLAINDLMINNIPVDITLYDLTNGRYRAVSTATKNYESYRVAVDIRESVVNSLFKYAYAFGTAMNLRRDGLTDIIHGDIHANSLVSFAPGLAVPWPDMGVGATIDGNVTAVNGVGALFSPASDPLFEEGNLNGGMVSGTIDGHVNPIVFPDMGGADSADILIPTADDYPDYFIHWSNPLYAPYQTTDSGGETYFNVYMTLQGTQVKIDFMDATDTVVLYTRTLPLPPHNLFYIRAGGLSVKGDINGRMTIACYGVSITDNIRYVDNEGDRAYVLKKNGVVVDPASTGAESWTAANGYTYEQNPDYNPAVPSNLTMRASSVNIPWYITTYNLEVHAAFISHYWSHGYGPNANRGNLRMVGSVVAGGGALAADPNHHYRLSTEMIHDPNLLINPPDWYPTSSTNIPTFFAWRRY